MEYIAIEKSHGIKLFFTNRQTGQYRGKLGQKTGTVFNGENMTFQTI